MQSNQTLLQKADLALSELTSDGGVLNEAQAKKFIVKLIKEGKMMGLATVMGMAAQKQEINKLRFANRVLRNGTPGVALAVAERSKPNLGRVELDAKLLKAEVRINTETLEDNIEGAALQQTMMDAMGAAIARDLDELFINGDTSSNDLYLATLDGVLKQATSHVVAAGGTVLTKSVLKSTLKALPIEYQRQKDMMVLMTSPNTETEYVDAMADRATPFGDNKLQQGGGITYQGVPLISLPMWPENLGGGQDETAVLYTDPKNINIGVWRKITVEIDRDIAAGVLLIVATMRVDMKFAEEDAVVKTTGVLVSA